MISEEHVTRGADEKVTTFLWDTRYRYMYHVHAQIRVYQWSMYVPTYRCTLATCLRTKCKYQKVEILVYMYIKSLPRMVNNYRILIQ